MGEIAVGCLPDAPNPLPALIPLMATQTKAKKKSFKYDEDLFKESTMTFGEHLEELRKSLFKALIGVILAFILALIPPVDLANRAVAYIAEPLHAALKEFYLRQSVNRELARLKELGLEGQSSEVLKLAIQENRMIPTPIFVDAPSLVADLQGRYPTSFASLKLPHFAATDLLDAPAFCRALLTDQAAPEASPGKRIWELMSPETQGIVKKVADVADKKQVAVADKQALAEAVAKIVDDPQFFREADYAAIASSALFETAVDQLIATAHARRQAHYNAALASGHERGSPPFNRLMLSAAYPDFLAGGPHMGALLPILSWRSVDDDFRAAIKSLAAHEMFMIFIKAALVVSLVISSPWVFYQIWNFVGAGLYPHEKRYVYIYGPISLLLFVAGWLLAFFFAFKPLLGFLLYFNEKMGVDPDIRISEWFGFAIFLPLGFGISFQLPLVMLFLERIGIVTIQTYKTRWRGAILIICIASMFLTPSGDPYSMLLMAVPLCLLYVGGILLCRYMPKGRNPFAEEV